MKPATCRCDAAALRGNALAIRKQIAAKNMLAVVKANAYGHGLGMAVNALRDCVDGFAVTEMQAAQTIRQTIGNETPLLLLAGADDENETKLAAELNIWLAVHTPAQLSYLSQLPETANITALVKTNSGMNRLGFAVEDAAAALDALNNMPQVAKTGLMSHFACADNKDGLNDALRKLQPLRSSAGMISLGNSAASLLHADIGDEWARIGIALYGSSPAPEWQSREALGLRAVMTVEAPVVAVQNLTPGDAVGYGALWRATNPTRIGIVSCGYNSGYPQNIQSWKEQPFAVIENQKAPVVGRPSMEMLAVDITECPAADVGSTAILWGDSPSIDEVAVSCSRLSYDLLCAAGSQS